MYGWQAMPEVEFDPLTPSEEEYVKHQLQKLYGKEPHLSDVSLDHYMASASLFKGLEGYTPELHILKPGDVGLEGWSFLVKDYREAVLVDHVLEDWVFIPIVERRGAKTYSFTITVEDLTPLAYPLWIKDGYNILPEPVIAKPGMKLAVKAGFSELGETTLRLVGVTLR